MKKLIGLSLIFAIVFSGCKKDEETIVSSSGYTAKVDGINWKASHITASIYNGTIVVVGEASDGSAITFSLNGDSLGLYPLNENTNSSGSYTFQGSKSFTSGGSSVAGGQVLIESISASDRTITGSIELKAVRASDDSTINITSGRFVDISYDNTPIGIEDNILKTQINGSNWSPQNVSGFVAFKTIFLKAIDADGIRVLTFELPELIGPGNYELNFFSNYKAIYTSIAGKKHYAVSGNIEVLSHNLAKREIVANFDIVTEAHEGDGIVKFTEGEFKIIYE
jgi:hypothetical protein